MDRPQIYMTKEQAARVAALLIDSLVGAQLESDCADNSDVSVVMVSIDNPNHLMFYSVAPDGSYIDQT